MSTDLRHIAEDLIEDLRECKDGTDITTWKLVRDAGYDMDSFVEWDLFDVHTALFGATKANHINKATPMPHGMGILLCMPWRLRG